MKPIQLNHLNRTAILLPLLAMSTVAAAQATRDDATAKPGVKPADPRWLERMDEIDRTLLDENLGYAPPEMTDDLRWSGSSAMTWQDMRGKVVVLQSWTSANNAGRGAPDRAQRALNDPDFKRDVLLIMLHTPDGAAAVDPFLRNRNLSVPVLIDPVGKFCDELGVYQRPVNIVIDRNGVVRHAGLSPAGLTEAVSQLLAEKHDPDFVAPKRADAAEQTQEGSPRATDDQAIEFPRFTNTIAYARDLRGRRAPDMYVARWLSSRPDPGNRLVLIDFWATWCGPCVRAIPHVNDLAQRYSEDLLCVGVSDEQPTVVQNFMRSTRMNYAVGVDPQKRMMSAFGVTGIPHVAVISSDWVVRWQGMPSELTNSVMDQLVAANRQLASKTNPTGRYRWTGGK